MTCPVDAIVLSIDANQITGKANSFSVIQAWYASDGRFYLLDQWRDQCHYEELFATYKRFCKKHNPVVVLIERAANGYSLLRDARSRSNNRWIEAIISDQRSKIERPRV